jgi:hypothetical protein
VDESIRAAGLLRLTPADSRAWGDGLRRAALRGDVERLRRGAFVGTDHWAQAVGDDRHRLLVNAALAAASTPVLVSHRSAAVLWGLPLVGVADERVHLTYCRSSGGLGRGPVARHAVAAPLAGSLVDGMGVTTPARTVVDLARVHGFVTGVAAGDAALRSGLVTPDELLAEVAAIGGRRGVAGAREVVAFVDGRSESPGESLSRARMREFGLSLPTLQHDVFDGRGFVGRVDFWWEEYGVFGEFDGRAKYGLDGEPGAAAARLWDEKLREDRLRATGPTMARWTWIDAWRGEPMIATLRRAGVR